MTFSRFQLVFAQFTAWRGFYLYLLGAENSKIQIMRFTFDPTAPKPHIILSLRCKLWRPRNAQSLVITLPAPFLPYRPSAGRLYAWSYRKSSLLQCRLDGRYGWGTEIYREMRESQFAARDISKDRLSWTILIFGLGLYGGLGLVIAMAAGGAK